MTIIEDPRATMRIAVTTMTGSVVWLVAKGFWSTGEGKYYYKDLGSVTHRILVAGHIHIESV